MTSSLDYDFGGEDVAKNARVAGKAIVLARYEVNERLGSFLANAASADEFAARLAYVDEVLSDVAHRKMANISDGKAKLAKALFTDWQLSQRTADLHPAWDSQDERDNWENEMGPGSADTAEEDFENERQKIHGPGASEHRPQSSKQSPNFNVRPAADKHVHPMDQNGDPGPYNRVKGIGGLEDEGEEDRSDDLPDLFDHYSSTAQFGQDSPAAHGGIVSEAADDVDDEEVSPRQRRHQEALERITNPSVVDQINQNNPKGPAMRTVAPPAPAKPKPESGWLNHDDYAEEREASRRIRRVVR